MARPRKTTKHHKATGNFRPSRHGTIALPVEIPPMPPDLSPMAQATWNVVSEHLRRSGLIARIDLHALRLLAESFELYLAMHDDVMLNGGVITEETLDGREKRVRNPATLVRAQAWKEVVQLLKLFGMAPAARTGLRIGETGGEESDEQKAARILGLSVVG